MKQVAVDYPWLVWNGTWGADMRDCTNAEMDRRLIILEEVSARKLSLTNGVRDAP